MKIPKRANPPTQSPITEPPRNATFTVSPIFSVSLALFATRTLEYVAIFIPTNPAHPDITEPRIRASAACQVVTMVNIIATTATTVYNILYS